uniref:Uncharacterized protein n=1 Tax=Arundo donax TaxID=35708 RepID=A0A0A9G739_ARUDO
MTILNSMTTMTMTIMSMRSRRTRRTRRRSRFVWARFLQFQSVLSDMYYTPYVVSRTSLTIK